MADPRRAPLKTNRPHRRARPDRRGAILRRYPRRAAGRRGRRTGCGRRDARRHHGARRAGNSGGDRDRARCRRKQRHAYDAAIALGCVIRGDTIHFEIVSIESARALMDLVGRQRVSRSATASSPSTPKRRPGRGRAPAKSTRAATPRVPRSRCCASSAAGKGLRWQTARSQRKVPQESQPPRRRAARRRAGAVPDGHRRRRHERHLRRVRKPLARQRGRRREISAGRGRVLRDVVGWRGARPGASSIR